MEIIDELQVPREQVFVVPHGATAAPQLGEDAKLALKRLGVPDDYFLLVGADYAHKNLRLVLAGYALMRARWNRPGEPPALVLVGHASRTAGGLFPSLVDSRPPGVRYLGQVGNADLAALYSRALALLFLSAYEGFGLPILEAMSAGTPVLCSKLTAVPEVAGDAALYIERLDDRGVSEGLLRLATDAGLRAQLTERGRRRASTFTWAETARKTLAVYQQAARAPSTASLHHRRRYAGLVARLFA
jgi:glycosyltransferase involved in cell wall biosynthesis